MSKKTEQSVVRAAMRRAVIVARTLLDFASDQGHDGNPPAWDKKCNTCRFIREQRAKVERLERACAANAKSKKGK